MIILIFIIAALIIIAVMHHVKLNELKNSAKMFADIVNDLNRRLKELEEKLNLKDDDNPRENKAVSPVPEDMAVNLTKPERVVQPDESLPRASEPPKPEIEELPQVFSEKREVSVPPLTERESGYESDESLPLFENWLGQKVFGIIAAILIFIGLIFLGTLIYERINDAGKIFLMYAVSASLTAGGIILTKKKRNNFTLTLAGCGCGGLFISTLMSHVYFSVFPDYAAFSAILIWMAATLYMSHRYKTSLFSVIAHIGMAVSLCFAFGEGFSEEKLGLILFYQWAGTAVIVNGNYFFSKKTYRLGLFVSLILSLVASGFMADEFFDGEGLNNLVALSFLGQFLCMSVLSYFLTAAVNKKPDELTFAAHACNKVLWLISLYINVLRVVYEFVYNRNISRSDEAAVMLLTAAGLAILAVHAAITLIMSKKFSLNKTLETISVSALCIFAGGLLIYCYVDAYGTISWLFILGAAMFLIYKLFKNRTHLFFANICICFDALFMLSDGYDSLYEKLGAAPFLYLLMTLSLMAAQWLLLNKEDKEIYEKYNFSVSWIKIISYIIAEASIIAIFEIIDANYRGDANISVACLCALLALNIGLYIFKFDKSSPALKVIMKINEIALLVVASAFIAGEGNALLTLLSFGLAFIRLNSVFGEDGAPLRQVMAGVKFTVLTMCAVEGFTSWFDENYIFSIICMTTALAAVLAGFRFKAKPLRVYGLIITILCVIKLVTFDISGLSSPMRVISMIAGGLICFAINAAYNYAVKTLGEKKES